MHTTLQTCITRADNMLSTELEGEITLMNVADGQYYHLNTMATKIWQLLETPCRIETLCEQLQNQYQVSVQQCSHDVLQFVQNLVDKKLLCVT